MPISIGTPTSASGFSPYAMQAQLAGNQMLAQAYSQGAQMRQQQAMAERQMQTQTAIASANNIRETGMQQAQLDAQQNMEAQRTQLGYAGLEQRDAGQQAELAAAQQRQVQSAQLDVWANQQKLTQIDVANNQQQANAVSKADQLLGQGLIDQTERDNIVVQAKTGMDRFKQRQQQQQADSMEEERTQRAAQAKAQTEILSQQLAFRKAASEGEAIYEPNAEALPGLRQEVADEGILQPGTPAFDAEVKKLAIERGQALRYYVGKDGIKLPDKDYNDARRHSWEANVNGKGAARELTQEQTSKHAAEALKQADAWAKAQPGEKPPSLEAIQNEAKRRFDFMQSMAQGSQGSGKPTPLAPPELKAANDEFDRQIAEIQTSAVSGMMHPQEAGEAVNRLKHAQSMLAKYKSFELMPPRVQASVKQDKEFVNGLGQIPQRAAVVPQGQVPQGQVSSVERSPTGEVRTVNPGAAASLQPGYYRNPAGELLYRDAAGNMTPQNEPGEGSIGGAGPVPAGRFRAQDGKIYRRDTSGNIRLDPDQSTPVGRRRSAVG